MQSHLFEFRSNGHGSLSSVAAAGVEAGSVGSGRPGIRDATEHRGGNSDNHSPDVLFRDRRRMRSRRPAHHPIHRHAHGGPLGPR
jgi:hypothetical protein